MRIVLYTNILTPYRKYFFDELSKKCEENNISFNVLVMAETEPNRNWKYDDLKTNYTILLENKSYTFGDIYIHYNPNLKDVINTLNPTHVICAGSYLCPGVNTILNMSKKLNYETFFWSESHLYEEKNNSKLKNIVREFIRNYIYKKFDGFWYAGKLSLDFIEKYASKNFKKIFVPNLVNNEVFDYHKISNMQREKISEYYNISKEKITFFCPARLTTVKGIDLFLKCIKNYDKKDKFQFLLAGDGELRNDIERISKNSNIDVSILNYLSQEEVAQLYCVVDFFLMPSLSDPNPLTCIEALWSGLPLLVSNHVGNYPEVVKEDKNGFVFNYDKRDELYNILDSILLKNEEWYKEAKEYSYNLACHSYNASDVALEIINKPNDEMNKI